MTRTAQVPVIMYHSVGLESLDWVWNRISMPVRLLRRQLEAIARCGYRTIHLDEYADLARSCARPHRAAALTFDDGFLDNWVYVFPLLTRMQMKATIFVNPEFVDPTGAVRPTLEDCWSGRTTEGRLSAAGYLSWAELDLMQQSGLVDIQSHTMSHTWLFSGPRIVDFYRPGSGFEYPWMAWNARPEQKYRWLTEDQEGFVPYGRPIYEHGRALGITRYLGDKGLEDHLVRFVRDNRSGAFFDRGEVSLGLLREQERAYRTRHGERGTFETAEEQDERSWHELAESRRIIEEKLGNAVRYVCWPGGGLTGRTVSLAAAAGYVGATLPSSMADSGLESNRELLWIRRIGSFARRTFRGASLGYADPSLLIRNMAAVEGDRLAIWTNRFVRRLERISDWLDFIRTRGKYDRGEM